MSQPIQIIVFGASGDLAQRKLVPALTRLYAERRSAEPFSVVGVARRKLDEAEFRDRLRAALPAEQRGAFDRLAPNLFYHPGDVADSESLRALAARLDALPGGPAAGRLFYLALRPELFAPAVHALAGQKLLHAHEPGERAWRRLVIEKPFGRDLASARELSAELHAVLREEQIYRIDHYLGKETVQNLLGLRFHNAIFEPLWNRHHVASVQITAAEDIGVEAGRGHYYDGSGALRDMVQSHLLQLLALVAMEPPVSLAAEAVRGQKVEVLRSLLCPDPRSGPSSVRARYAPTTFEGERLPGYLEEEGVAPDSQTETYVALRAQVVNWRWNGVPFLLRHGKRLAQRFTEIRVQFRTPPVQLFNRPPGLSDAELQRQLESGLLCQVHPNALVLSLQPREAIGLRFGVKQPGPAMTMTPAALEFDYRSHFGQVPSDAYSRLLVDALAGDQTLFLRADEIEAAWRYIDEVRAQWQGPAAPPLLEYPAGSEGPAQATALLSGCDAAWSRGPAAPIYA